MTATARSARPIFYNDRESAPDVAQTRDAATEISAGGTPMSEFDTTTPPEDAEAAPEKSRRGRGNLEADVKAICDKFVTGEIVLEPSEFLTPHRIAKKIVEIMEPDSNIPSTGAVSAVLKRFEKYGFITCHATPYSFADYTDRGRTDGLRALREEWKAAQKPKDVA